MFKLPHLIFIIFTLFSVPFFAIMLKKLNVEKLQEFMQTLTLIVICFDPAYWIWEYANFKHFNLASTLPLYICSLFWLLMPLAVYSRPSRVQRITRATIASVVLFAGTFGLVFNTHLNHHAFFSFVPIRSLLYHYLMILTSVSFWTTGYYKPTKGDGPLAMIPVYIILIPCITFSYLFSWDYAFTAGGIGTPLETLSQLLSRPLYLIALYGLATLVICSFSAVMRRLMSKVS